MQRVMVGSVAAILACGLIGFGQEEKTHRKASPEDYKKFAGAATFSGKLAGVGPKSVSVYLEDPAYKRQHDMYMVKANAMPAGPAKTARLGKLEADFQKSNQGKEFEFELADKAHLRKLNLGFGYDDKGSPLKYGPKEIAKLKGDASKPGYVAKAEDLSVGSPVVVHLTKTKDKIVATMVVVNNKTD